MKTGLVMEGGAMRGLFTAGVIDLFMEKGIEFHGAIGVSAGAAFGCNYKSKQIGRTLRYNKNIAVINGIAVTVRLSKQAICTAQIFAIVNSQRSLMFSTWKHTKTIPWNFMLYAPTWKRARLYINPALLQTINAWSGTVPLHQCHWFRG